MHYTLLSSNKSDYLHSKDYEVIFAMPFTDPVMAEKTAKIMAKRSNYPGLIIGINDVGHEGFVKTVNRVFKNTQSSFFGYVAQDAFPGRDWLRIAMDSLEKTQTSLFAFNDGKWHGKLAGFGLSQRNWAGGNYQGDFFYPGYEQHYADFELSLLAQKKGLLSYNPNSVLIEVDWEKDYKITNLKDKILFEQRFPDYYAAVEK